MNVRRVVSGASAGANRARILAEHETWLRLVLFARLRDRHAVDEVMQEMALAVIRARNLPPEPSEFPPWLHRLAIRQALLYRRRQGRRDRLWSRYAERWVGHLGLAPSSDPLDWLMKAERLDMVREAVATLPGRDAEILLLRYSADWNGRQLASHLGLSLSAVDARLHRARQRLRALLEQRELVEVRK